MILLTHETRILLCVAPADFRRVIDGFVAQCLNTLALQPRDGSVIVFINRARTIIRSLSCDVNGYWLMTKRLSQRGCCRHRMSPRLPLSGWREVNQGIRESGNQPGFARASRNDTVFDHRDALGTATKTSYGALFNICLVLISRLRQATTYIHLMT